MINAPWPSLAVVAAILLSYLWQSTLGGGEAAAQLYGLIPADLDRGRLMGLVTMVFIHAGWAHAGMNAVAALAFGPPVARLMGRGATGAVGFFSFYLVCGLLAGLGYAVMHLHQVEPAIGASGAVSGLMGAASRLYGAYGGDLNPLRSRPVVSLAVSWILVNALMAVFGAPLAGAERIAWEAHIAGFVAGVLLIDPWSRLFGPKLARS